MAVASRIGSAKETAWISALRAKRPRMLSDRILPPVSGGKRGRGNVSRIFIALVLTSYWETNATPVSNKSVRREGLLLRSEPPGVRASDCHGPGIPGSKARNSGVASNLQWQIGRASCRERVKISEGSRTIKKKQ